jgi:hypothetical protein
VSELSEVATVTHKPTGKRGYLFEYEILEDTPFHVSLEDSEGAEWCEGSDIEVDETPQVIEIDDPAACGFQQGAGKTCIYLALGGDPMYNCTRGTSIQKIIEERHAAGTMNSKYRPTAMFPSCQHVIDKVDSVEESAAVESA